MRSGPAREAPNRLQRWLVCEASPWANAAFFGGAMSAVFVPNVLIMVGLSLGSAAVLAGMFGAFFVVFFVAASNERRRDGGSRRVWYWPSGRRSGSASP